VFVLLASTAPVLRSARPVGYVISSEPFQLRGATVPTAVTHFLPVVEGDDIATDSASAILTFLDGSRITLARQSRAKLEAGGVRTRVRLLNGTMQYRLSESPQVEIYSRGLRQTGTYGTVSAVAVADKEHPAPPPQARGPKKPPPVSPSR
jgi:ferric-dicitrate binding protein FerR (iron transport regulator)